MNIKTLCFLCLFTITGFYSAQAQMLPDITFTFSGTSPFTGVVTGELIGLTDGNGVTPTDIIITSGLGLSNYDLTGDFLSGSFNVSSGQITGVNNFLASNVDSTITLYLNYFGDNHLFKAPSGNVDNSGGFGGVTYTPEPSTYMLLALGLVGLAVAGRFKMRRSS